MQQITVFAPAKINLGLRITGRYENGYHRLETIFAPVSIYDRITVEPANFDSVRHTWPAGTTISQKRTLEQGISKNPLLSKILKFVREAVRNDVGTEIPPQRVLVTKRIPSPAGLGGASSDAAALALALYQAYAPDRVSSLHAPAFLKKIANLGADIPFFLRYGLAGEAALLIGIGHELNYVQIPQLTGFVIVPPFGFSTARMFSEVRSRDLPSIGEQILSHRPNLTLRLNEIPFSDSLADRVKVVHNDFDAVAQTVFPAESQLLGSAKTKIALALEQLLQGQWIIGMTGSGAGLFAAAESASLPTPRAEVSGILRSRLGGAWSVIPFMTPGNIGP